MAINIIKLGNDKLNINTSTAKGLEKAIGKIARFTISAQSSINKTIYGEFKLQNDPTANKIQKALDKGISNTLSDLVGINYCDIANFLATQGGPSSFNPNNPPQTDDVIEKIKWNLQKAAFDIQKNIDEYYQLYGELNNPQSRANLFALVQQIKSILVLILSPESGINNPILQARFIQLSVIASVLDDVLGGLDQFTNPTSVNEVNARKILSTVQKVRAYCIAIIGLQSVGSFVNLANAATGGAVQRQLAELSKIVDFEKIIPLLKQIIGTVNNLNSIAQKLLGYINSARLIIKVCLSIIEVYNKVKAFFIALAIPNATTTTGVTTKFSDIYQSVLKEQGEKKLLKRLNQINAVLNLMAICITSLSAGIQDILNKLNLIKLNIEACNTDLSDEIQDTINNLNKTK
jgi:sugar-specific transcriptional regulator TrmB